jgi:uncharacterized protein with HEPN domain
MKNTNVLLQDMVEAIKSIQSYSLPTYDSFLDDEKTQDAVMYNLIILGEAANRISVEFQESHPEIPWSSIIGTRNVVVHGYDQVKSQIVWDIINKNLEKLKILLEDLM